MTGRIFTPYPPKNPPPPPPAPPPAEPSPVSMREALLLGAYGLQTLISGYPAVETFPKDKLPSAVNLLWACSLVIEFSEKQGGEA